MKEAVDSNRDDFVFAKPAKSSFTAATSNLASSKSGLIIDNGMQTMKASRPIRNSRNTRNTRIEAAAAGDSNPFLPPRHAAPGKTGPTMKTSRAASLQKGDDSMEEEQEGPPTPPERLELMPRTQEESEVFENSQMDDD
jgi:hypothetical protein